MLTAVPETPKGFTLIEMLIIVVVLAVLSTIAIPNYSRYVARGQLVEATNALTEYRDRMEQYFRQHRGYGSSGRCGVAPPVDLENFLVTCAAAADGRGFTATATGLGEIAGFAYTINEANVRTTAALPPHWGELPADAGHRWVTR